MTRFALTHKTGRLRRAVAAMSGSALIVGLVVIAGANPAAAATHTMQIDATALSTTSMNIINPDGTTTPHVTTTTVITQSLQEGVYSFNNGESSITCSPTVTAAGTWSIPSSCGASASGQGTSTLRMAGAPITLDATGLSTGLVTALYGPPTVHAGTSTTLILMPQSPIGLYVASAVQTSCSIGLDSSGKASVANCGSSASASGSTVVFHGFAVSIDARSLSTDRYVITNAVDLYSVLTPSGVVQNYHLLEAPFYSFQTGSALVATFTWGVSMTGRITFASSNSTFLAGAGTTTLVIKGLTVNVNATALGSGNFTLGPDVLAPSFDQSVAHDLHLVPSGYEFLGAGPVAPPMFHWTLHNNGKPGFIPGYPHLCAYAAGTTLVVDCRPPTSTTLSGTPNPATGEFRMTALECDLVASIHPTGTIAFTDVTTGTKLATVALSPSPSFAHCSVAYFTDTEALAAGNYKMKAVYTPGGSTPVPPSTPGQYTEKVNPH